MVGGRALAHIYCGYDRAQGKCIGVFSLFVVEVKKEVGAATPDPYASLSFAEGFHTCTARLTGLSILRSG